MSPELTLAACLTPPGTGAIAVVAVRGPRAWEAVQPLFASGMGSGPRQTPTLEPDRCYLGRFGDAFADEVVLAVKRVHPTPWLELQCHGGVEVVRMCLEALDRRGVAICPWQQLLRITTDNPLRAAAEVVLAHTPTARTAAIVLDQCHGAFEAALRAILAAHAEGKADAAGRLIAELARYIPVGRHLMRPWRLVIAGAPNVGKSSLANALAGYPRSVVSPVPGTTRDVVASRLAIAGWPVELADTAGLREGIETVEAAGIHRARETASMADLCLWVLDGSSQPVWPDLAAANLHFAINKADLPAAWDWQQAAGAVCVSALAGKGVAELAESLEGWLVPDPPPAGAAVPFTPELCDEVREAEQLHATGGPAEACRVLRAIALGLPDSKAFIASARAE